MSAVALLDTSSRTDEGSSHSPSISAQPDVYQVAEAKAAKASGPAAHEITVHKAAKLSRDRGFNASGSFVHFAQHGLRNAIDDRAFLEAGGVRSLRQRFRWYESRQAAALRKCLRSRCFQACSLLALLVALFFPDLFVLLQVPSNYELDAILSTAFTLFVTELVGLACSDPAYPFSFFFCMDLLGTFSMCFDISFVLGPDASLPERYKGSTKHDGQFIIVRAARAARLGARAGRLSRVVKILRFLNSDDDDTELQVKMAKVISNKLSDVLSIRVAFLTICIAVVLPSFQMFEYPEMDESMIAWTQILTADVQSYKEAAVGGVQSAKHHLFAELERFGTFYNDCLYGPFKVCTGHDLGDEFKCEHNELEIDVVSGFSEPRRGASVLELNEGGFQVFYDMATPHRMEAVMGMGMICFIILVMVVFSMLLSSNISVIALTPLERMLSVVRQRCKQIFKYTNELQEDEVAQTEEDEDTEPKASEFQLLERAVSKLVAIAALSTKAQELDAAELDEHRAVVMGWMGQQGPRKGVVASKYTARFTTSIEGSALEAEMSRLPASVGLNTSHFDSMLPNRQQKIELAAYVVLTLPTCADYVQALVGEETLLAFSTRADALYPANPFHNFAHALDVAHATALSFRLLEAGSFFTEAERFWLVVAALGHDLGHVGLNNQFLVETSHELAVTYNDKSPLENMHCCKLFQLIAEPEANVFNAVPRDEYKEIRKGIIHAILHTDITKHNEMVKELSLLYQMHSHSFESCDEESCEVLSEHSQTIANALLHCADIGNPMKPWELCRKLAFLVLDEYFAQGDREKLLGLPVQMLNDREKVSRPNSQIGFAEFMLAPWVEAMVQLFPPLDLLALNLGRNIKRWANEWIAEASPTEDAVEKVRLRVQKVVAKCQALLEYSGQSIEEEEP